MAASFRWFANAFDQAFQGKINWPSDTLNMILLSSSASPNLATWVHYSDVTNELATGNGYTQGGVTLTSVTHSLYVGTSGASNLWGVQWAATYAYAVGQVVRPPTANGYLYRCVQAGTTGGSAPTWPTVPGETVTDSGVIWVNCGSALMVWSSAAAQWPSSSISGAEDAIIYDAQTGVASTSPLLFCGDPGQSESDSNGMFQVTPDTNVGWFSIATP